MALKNILVIATVLVIFQNASGVPIEDSKTARGAYDQYLNEAKQAISELNNIVTTKMTHSIDDLTKNLNELDELNKSAFKSATEALQSAVTISLKQIEDMRQYALNNGKNPEDCIGNNEEEIKKKPVEKINEMLACNDEHVNTPKEEVRTAIEEISKQTQPINELEKKLTACGDNNPYCWMDITSAATKQTAAIPEKIVSLEIPAQKAVIVAKEQTVACTAFKANEAQNEVARTTQTISDCIEKL